MVQRNLDFVERRDVCRYLNNTICRYKQEFVYVTCNPYDQVQNIHEINILPFGGKKQKILCTDDDFSVHMPELGYVNTVEGAFYLKRQPVRDQKAGLALEMIRYGTRRPISGIQYLKEPEGHRMLINEYPSYKDVAENISWEGIRSFAFHKNLCIAMLNRYSKVIEYKGEIAAMCDPRTNEWYIPQPRQDTSFIRAILVRNGVEVK